MCHTLHQEKLNVSSVVSCVGTFVVSYDAFRYMEFLLKQDWLIVLLSLRALHVLLNF